MTGYYLRILREGRHVSTEIEHCSDEELVRHFALKDAREIIGYILTLAKCLRELEEQWNRRKQNSSQLGRTGGSARWANIPPEERKKIMQRMAKKRWAAHSAKEQSEIMQRVARKRWDKK